LELGQREKLARVAAYTAQVMEGVAKGFNEYKSNEDLAKLVNQNSSKTRVPSFCMMLKPLESQLSTILMQ
jgi:hypothetical protein